jgi:hypothetical protein
LAAKELKTMIIKPSTESCIKKIKRNFLLLRVFVNSQRVIVAKLILSPFNKLI